MNVDVPDPKTSNNPAIVEVAVVFVALNCGSVVVANIVVEARRVLREICKSVEVASVKLTLPVNAKSNASPT